MNYPGQGEGMQAAYERMMELAEDYAAHDRDAEARATSYPDDPPLVVNGVRNRGYAPGPCACTRPGRTISQVTVVLTVDHDCETSPAQIVAGALAKIRDAVHAVADDRYAELEVRDVEVGTVVEGAPRTRARESLNRAGRGAR